MAKDVAIIGYLGCTQIIILFAAWPWVWFWVTGSAPCLECFTLLLILVRTIFKAINNVFIIISVIKIMDVMLTLIITFFSLIVIIIVTVISCYFHCYYTYSLPVIPFLLLGIGIDNIFVITQTFNTLGKTTCPVPCYINDDIPPSETTSSPAELTKRFGQTMKHAGNCLTVLYRLGLLKYKPAAQAAGADPSRWSFTSRQNPPIQQNRRNFWTNKAILMPFRI